MAVGRGFRAAVVTVTGFALGLWLFHNIEVAVFSGFAGIAITGIADFRGRRRFRVAAVGASTVLGAVLVVFGTLLSTRSAGSQMVVIFLVVAAVSFGRVMGGYSLGGADAVTLFYLVAAGSSAPTSALPSRLAGVALGGALAVLVAYLPADRVTPPELGRMLGHLTSEAAERLDRVSRADQRSLTKPKASDRATTTRIRQIVDRRPDRPSGPIPSQRAALYLVNDLERLHGLLTRLEGDDRPLTPHEQHSLGELSTQLAQAASSLDGPGDPIARASLPVGDGFGLVARLSVVTRSITVHAASLGPQDESGGWMDTGAVREFVIHAGRRFRANLNPHSVRLQDSVRLGLGLMVGVLAIHLLDLQHGFWVALATLSVVKSDATRTAQSLVEAVVGTAVGFVIAALIIEAIGSRPGWLAAALPLTLFAAFYAKGALSFLVGQAAFTMAVLVMFNLLAPFGWSLGLVRLEDVVAGALIGLAVGVLAWPRGAEASLGWITSRLVDTSSGYLVAVIDDLWTLEPPMGSDGSNPSPDRMHQSALDSSILADDALAELLERESDPTGTPRRVDVISFGNRMRYAGDLISEQGGRVAITPAVRMRVHMSAELLEQACRQLAARLRGSEGGTRRDRPADPPVDPDPYDDLTLWIHDLTESAHALLATEPTERRIP
jgi:uncharacterized membrane protein YccC